MAVLSVFVREPAVRGADEAAAQQPRDWTGRSTTSSGPALEAWLNNNKTAADAIVGRIILAAKAREASPARPGRGEAEDAGQPAAEPARQAGRLQDRPTGTTPSCSSSRGTRPAARPSRGGTTPPRPCCRCGAKSSTARSCRRAKVLQNQELADLVNAIGTGAGDKFHYDGLRYGKIILLMDADADGHHIATLLLDFFFRHMPGPDPQGARLHRPAAALPDRRGQGDATGPRTTSTRRTSWPGCGRTPSRTSPGSRGSARCRSRCSPRPRSTRATGRC